MLNHINQYRHEIQFTMLFVLGINILNISFLHSQFVHLASISVLFVLMLAWVKSISQKRNPYYTKMALFALTLSFFTMLGATQLKHFDWVELVLISFLFMECLVYLLMLKRVKLNRRDFSPQILIPVILSLVFLVVTFNNMRLTTNVLAVSLVIIANVLLFYSFNLRKKSILIVLGMSLVLLGQMTAAIKQFLGDFPFEYFITTCCFYLGRIIFLKSIFDDLVHNSPTYTNKYVLIKK